MAILIKSRQIVTDSWQLLKASADGSGVVPAGDVIVPLEVWSKERDRWLNRTGKLGVWLDSNEDPSRIADDFKSLAVVAVNFPQFTDGRGYSIARLLRERYGWSGELRAIGDVLRDQLFYLSRCGFDAFSLRGDQDAQAALLAFDDFSEGYQASVERPQPLFRRRALIASEGVESV